MTNCGAIIPLSTSLSQIGRGKSCGREAPGVYESYVDLQPGEWTKVRIAVKDVNASLFVGDAAQPCLLIHDLKLGAIGGGIALWIGPGTEGYFRNLHITGHVTSAQGN